MFASTDIREHLASQAMCSYTGADYSDTLESLSIGVDSGDSDELEGPNAECADADRFDVELIASAIEPKDIQCRMIRTYLDDSGNTVHVYESLQSARTNLAMAIVAELLTRSNN